MNRRVLPWLVAGAGVALVAGALVAHRQPAGASAGRQPAAPVQLQGSPSGRPSGMSGQARTAGGDTIALALTPDQFGTYTFTVVVRDAAGAPLQGATVGMVLTMLDMRMAALQIALPPIGPPVPGSYRTQGVLMGGRWQAVVRVQPPGATRPVEATFRFFASE
jgi:hypothetical protein